MDSTARLAFATVLACSLAAGAHGGFPSQNISLLSHVPFGDFASNPSGANDCWGYVSASGREYALIGLRASMGVVEVTDPANPVIIGEVPHISCTWSDMKLLGDYCYVVNDCSGGFDVVDLSDVDNGNITHLGQVTVGGVSKSHNVAIDTDSGFLYLCGSNLAGGRLVACDLSNPVGPTIAGEVASDQGAYVHDAQVVTYTTGPYAGLQIAFCANGGVGLDIYDVTDKSDMFRLSRTAYEDLTYAHQCWLSEDRQFLYLNDELDGIDETVIFNVSDLSAPYVVNTYTSAVEAYDHNLYVHDGYVYEAQYRAGVRVFCAEDPTNPVQVGWFDTHPDSDAGGFDGVWSVYPYFPSGILIASDMSNGLFVLDVTDALDAGSVVMDYPGGRPPLIDPQGGTTMAVNVLGSCGGAGVPGTGLLHYDDGQGFASLPMQELSDNVYEAVFPAVTCGADVAYYVSAQTSDGETVTDPVGAPLTTFVGTAAVSQTIAFEDDFETDQGWVPVNLGATAGDFERGVPIDDPNWPFDPATDGDGSGQCWLTGNQPGDSDVDDGAVRLVTPEFDLSAGTIGLSYEYFLRLTAPNGFDGIRVEASSSGDAGPWIELARHVLDGGLSWHHREFSPGQIQAAGLALTASFKLRFTVPDGDPPSIVEAGLDGFRLLELQCESVPGDVDGDGIVGINDFLAVLGSWGACPGPCPPSCPADLDDDCEVGINDFLIVLGNWTS